ncbi:sugar phosphate isomerase/epimerase family protein [Nesterenkonia haasae]|uniref:sugar phosphate isomerase/epimerase family protein n=1 Tax=Nesterenkonia haasae TaxID=2587813 RepID=UPI001391202E|nr:TIM barrel protein [Nesterenkonia haasae]NDK31647.1 sugar phosphate isomerase/epimerase [Nesterenkonia haasae]
MSPIIGLSTYAYLWRWSEVNPEPMTLQEMIIDTAELGAEVFQICDYPPLEMLGSAELRKVRRTAESSGVVLELGTRGIRREHLQRYAQIAESLGATFIRSMVQPRDTPVKEAADLLGGTVDDFSARGLRLGLETYEQISSLDLVGLVATVDSPALGIVLDPGNCVANLELPGDVVERTAPWVNNLHIKDFTFTRQPGWVGFHFSGTPLGEGLLDYSSMSEAVKASDRGLHHIIEHWLPRRDSPEETLRDERLWTQQAIDYLGSTNP